MNAAPPQIFDSLTDLPRSAVETARLAVMLRALVAAAPAGDGGPVLVLPGYASGDSSTAVLRYFLRRIGHAPHRLGLGVNIEAKERRIRSVDDALAFRDDIGTQVLDRLRELNEQSGEPVSLVGWSMGGLYAFDAMRAEPARVRMVVTLGTPFGDPRGTALFSLLRRLSGSDVPLESQDYAGWLARRALPIDAPPVKILYSPRDGIVSPGIARVPNHPSVEHVAVDSSHIGFGVNPAALREVASQLAVA